MNTETLTVAIYTTFEKALLSVCPDIANQIAQASFKLDFTMSRFLRHAAGGLKSFCCVSAPFGPSYTPLWIWSSMAALSTAQTRLVDRRHAGGISMGLIRVGMLKLRPTAGTWKAALS